MNERLDPRTVQHLLAELREEMHTQLAGEIWHAESVKRYLEEGDDTGLIYAYRRKREMTLAAEKTFQDLIARKGKGGAE